MKINTDVSVPAGNAVQKELKFRWTLKFRSVELRSVQEHVTAGFYIMIDAYNNMIHIYIYICIFYKIIYMAKFIIVFAILSNDILVFYLPWCFGCGNGCLPCTVDICGHSDH